MAYSDEEFEINSEHGTEESYSKDFEKLSVDESVDFKGNLHAGIANVSVYKNGMEEDAKESKRENDVDETSFPYDVDSLDPAELHGKGNRMKLSDKPPEQLLAQYHYAVRESLDKKKFDLAVEDLIRITALTRIVYGDCHWKLAESEAVLANAYWKYKGLAAQAQQHAEEARNVMLRVVQAGPSQDEKINIYKVLLNVYVTLGEAHNAQNKFTDAETSFQKAEKIIAEHKKNCPKTKVYDNSLGSLADMKIGQGKLAANVGKHVLAVAYFEEAIEILRKEYGDDSIKLIPLYQMVGKVEAIRDGGSFVKSVESYLQAHSIANANYTVTDIEVADTGFEVALAYSRAVTADKDADTSAESYFNECLSIYQATYGPNNEKTIKCQDELARLMIRTSRQEEAIQLLNSSLPARKETFGEYSESVASVYQFVGSVHMSQGNMEKSLTAMTKELADAENQYKQVQQQQLSQLQGLVLEKEKQLSELKNMFNQLKEDFKYNLKLLKERDNELEQYDRTSTDLRSQLVTCMSNVSELSIKYKQAEDVIKKQAEEKQLVDKNYSKQLERERCSYERKLSEKVTEHAKKEMEWDSSRRNLEQQLQITEEKRIVDKRHHEENIEEQITARDREWKIKIDQIESERLALDLRVTSLSKENDKLREDTRLKQQLFQSSEAEQLRLEKTVKESSYELEDFRTTSNRVIQDLQSQLKSERDLQRNLIEKHERKIMQADLRVKEMAERAVNMQTIHNDKLNELQGVINKLNEEISLQQANSSRLAWRVEDMESERNKLIGQYECEKLQLLDKIKLMESNDSVKMIKDERDHLEKRLKDTADNLVRKNKDNETYKKEIVEYETRLADMERQRAKLELDCQKKCDDIQRSESDKSEMLINTLKRAREGADAKAKKLEKEALAKDQALLGLKKELSEAYNTLSSHGLLPSTSAGVQTFGKYETDEVEKLKVENERLKSSISLMRKEMESIGVSGVVPVENSRDALYIQSLEDEIKHLKYELRANDRSKLEGLDLNVENSLKNENDAVKNIAKGLSSTINSLRSEKVELVTATRKQQIEIERLKSKIQELKNSPNKLQLEMDQVKYELNSAKRQLAFETTSLKHRVEDLEKNLATSQEEAAEYHRCLLQANTENHALSAELAELKMVQARSQTGINYGAQELFIQTLQTENERLREQLKNKAGLAENQPEKDDLKAANAKIHQLQKEKAVLTELSNRLRSELLKAGISIKPANKNSPTVPVVSNQPLPASLDQVEKLQYELTKADIKEVKNIVSDKLGKENQPASKFTIADSSEYAKNQKPKSVQGEGRKAQIPAVVEQTSSSSSSINAKSTSVTLKPRQKFPGKFQAPLPNPKQKSNLQWISKTSKKKDKQSDVFNSDENPLREMEKLNSTSLGSSINDVWKLLDSQPFSDISKTSQA